MITTAEEYQKYLWQLQDQNKPVSAILLPSDENVYEIDLNKRTVKAPEFLSVKEEHAAETIYFLVDRFYDNMDLSTATCVIQYRNAAGEERFFPVPFYDITTFSNAVSDQFIRTMVEEKNYKKNTYFIRDDKYNYILTSDEFNPNQDYYIKNTPNLNNKYVKVNLTAQTYTSGNFYYIETDSESINFGQYCQALGEFDIQKTYFAKIDRRFMQVTVTASGYQKNYYYTINANGNLEIDNTGYNKDKAYFIFIDSQKILFPWIISSDVTAKEGKVEFSVRFYQIQPVKEQVNNSDNSIIKYKYLYNLNTQLATSIVLNGMNSVLEQEAEKFDQSILAGLYSEINRLSGNYELYWIEA